MIHQVRPYKRWPSGDSRALAVLRLSPEELASRFGLVFEVHDDDLDVFTLAAIQLPDGSQAWLERHEGDPEDNTLAHVDSDANLCQAKEELKQVLELTDSDFAWISPAAEEDHQTHPKRAWG